MRNGLINLYEREKQSYVLEVLIVILVVLFVMMLVYKPSEIDGASMEPTCFDADIAVMVSKKPKARDVVIADTYTRLIKRVVGLPGDKLEFRRAGGGVVDLYVNDVRIDESGDIKESMRADAFYPNWDAKLDTPFTLGADEYYICGDNRNISADSRATGPVKRGAITGVVVRIYPKDSFGAKLIRFIYRPESANDEAATLAASGGRKQI